MSSMKKRGCDTLRMVRMAHFANWIEKSSLYPVIFVIIPAIVRRVVRVIIPVIMKDVHPVTRPVMVRSAQTVIMPITQSRV